MKKIKKAVAVTGKYTDRNGNEKNQYHTCGGLFQRDDGSLCMKLDALPLGDFNGWISFYDIEENRKENNQQGMQQARQAAAPDDFEDPIPL
jgi:hypothetical protein